MQEAGIFLAERGTLLVPAERIALPKSQVAGIRYPEWAALPELSARPE